MSARDGKHGPLVAADLSVCVCTTSWADDLAYALGFSFTFDWFLRSTNVGGALVRRGRGCPLGSFVRPGALPAVR